LGLLANVLAQSLMVIAFALVPPLLARMGAASETAWRTSAGVFFLAQMGYVAWWLPRTLSAYRALARPVPRTMRLSIALFGLQVVVLALVVVAVIPTSFYLAALLTNLYFAGVAFVRVFLSIGQASRAAKPAESDGP